MFLARETYCPLFSCRVVVRKHVCTWRRLCADQIPHLI